MVSYSHLYTTRTCLWHATLFFFVVISYAVAAVLCVVVEFPLGTIEMLVFRLFVSKGRESRRQEQPIKDGSGVGLERSNRDSESDSE